MNGPVWVVLGEDTDFADITFGHHFAIYALVKTASETLRAPAFRRDNFPDLKGNLPFTLWVQESYDKAKETAYLNGKLEVVLVQGKQIPDEAKEVGPEYITKAQEVANLRVALASHRLADYVKQTLSKLKR